MYLVVFGVNFEKAKDNNKKRDEKSFHAQVGPLSGARFQDSTTHV